MRHIASLPRTIFAKQITDQELLEQLFGEFADIKIIHWEANK